MALVRRSLALLGLTIFAVGALPAQTLPPKLALKVPMRDGTLLATDVYLPAGTGPWPVVLVRDPYNKNGWSNGRSAFNRAGLVLVAQDTRGRYASEGRAVPVVDEGWGERQDGVDTVAWVRAQSWCNGRIAGLGYSYPAIAQLQLAGAGPEGIVGQYLYVAAMSPYHGMFYQNGVFRKGLVEPWLRQTSWPQDVLPLLRQHPSYDEFWRGQDLATRPQKVRWPAVHIGGWFDIFTQSTIDTFTALQEQGGEGARGRQHLVIGPWTHGVYTRTAGQLTFPANAQYPAGMPDEVERLRFWLTGQPESAGREPAVRYYVMGDVRDRQAPGNVWRSADRWPPPSQPLRLYLTPEGGLERQAPSTASTGEYTYDPANPVPTMGGQELFGSPGPRDQRPVEGRPDVLVFSTPPLAEPLEVTGRITVRLTAATSARDTDFTAKLCDVYPDERSMLLTDGIVRARYRRSLAEPVEVVPGERTTYEIDLGSTSIIFNRGHRIRVSISSSNAPRFEANPNTFPDRDAVPAVARQTITLGGSEASHIVLPEVVTSGGP
jgi:predicted acyl esterase